MRRVAYIWSPELMAVADALPANQGRSRTVHGLVRALELVDFSKVEEYTSAPASRSPSPDSEGQSPDVTDPVHQQEERAYQLGASRSSPSRSENNGRAATPEEMQKPSPSEEVYDIRVTPPDPALCEASELRRYHDPSYVDYLLYGPSDDEEVLKPRKKRRKDKSAILGLEYDCPPFPELGRYAALVAGATLTACRMLVEGEASVAIHWDGGRHHAARSRASGFCYVADAVLGIQLLCREGRPLPVIAQSRPSDPTPATAATQRRPRVMYLDLDLHYGDGVDRAFACPTHFTYPLSGQPRPPAVLTLSVHHVSPLFFPPDTPGTSKADTPHPFNLSLGLAEYASPATYARLWANVEKIRSAWRPDYVVLQLGVDGLPRDPIGQVGAWAVHGEGGISWVMEQVMSWDVPTVLLGGGGYDHANAARAWAIATGEVVGRELGADTDIPDHSGMDAFAPGFTLEVEPSSVPDRTKPEDLDEADRSFDVIAERIREILALQE